MTEHLKEKRIWELDFLRGIALVLMIYFHIIYDLKDLFNINMDQYNMAYNIGINFAIGRMAAILFMLISGISCYLSRNNVKRGLKVLGLAMIITIVTHLYDPNQGIKFGILHLLGTSMLLFPLLRKLNVYYLFTLATVLIFIQYYTSRMIVTFDYLFMFGITSNTFISSDYYPLVPWLGIFIYGILLGKLLYNQRRSIFNFTAADNILSKTGSHTLIIYFIHQPIIIAVLTIITRLLKWFLNSLIACLKYILYLNIYSY